MVESGWKSILGCKYWPNGNRLLDRKGILLFESMVESTSQAIMDAIDIFLTNPLAYSQMIRAGFDLLDYFSWDTAVEKYAAMFHEAKPPHSSKEGLSKKPPAAFSLFFRAHKWRVCSTR